MLKIEVQNQEGINNKSDDLSVGESAFSKGSNTTDADKTSPVVEPRPPIVYKIEYFDHDTLSIVSGPEADDRKLGDENEEPSVMEVIDVDLTRDRNMPWRVPPPWLSNQSKRKGRSYVRILSRAVVEALRCVVEYFPLQDLSGNTMIIYEPYEVVVHHKEALEKYRDRLAPSDSEDISPTCANRWAYKHLGIFLEFFENRIGEAIRKERERHARGVATWDMLWLLFKPGADVYWDEQSDDEYEPYVIRSMEFDLVNGTTDHYTLSLWNMDATSMYVGASEPITYSWKPFAGEKAITSLPCYPCEFLKLDKEGRTPEQRREFFEQRGKLWYKLRRKGCYHFDGVSYTYPKRSVSLCYQPSAEQADVSSTMPW